MVPIAVRPAGAEDAARLLAWRNDPAVRAMSRSQEPVGEQEHRAWLAAVLADPDRHLLIAEDHGEPAGQVRFDRLGESHYEISVALAPEARGRGLGTPLIEAGVRWLHEHSGPYEVDAVVRVANPASLRVFQRAGFETVGDEGEFVRLRRAPAP